MDNISVEFEKPLFLIRLLRVIPLGNVKKCENVLFREIVQQVQIKFILSRISQLSLKPKSCCINEFIFYLLG